MLTKQLDSAVDEQRPENVGDPMKSLNQTDAHDNEDAPHHQGTDDSPEQYFVLVLRSDAKVAENQEEDKEIIDAKRKFNHVTGDELHGGRVPIPRINQHSECAGQTNPEQAPGQRLTKFHRMARPLQEAQVDRQHAQHEKIEQNPEE